MPGRIQGKQVFISRAHEFMGPAIRELFAEEGGVIKADERDLTPEHAAAEAIREAGEVDILIVNLIAPDPRIILEPDTTEDLWQVMFDTMVHPMYRLCHAVLPQMRSRGSGKIVVMGSANAIRGTNNRSAYSAARGAQVSYVRSLGIELAPLNVHVNLMAQFLVENPTSVPQGKLADLTQRLPEIPLGRMAKGRESALLALYLASNESDFLVGQILPFAGGWTA
ncbi:SDR family NAD(P)-dependent oxidoreductase [Aestuariivirga sp.]|uniref:SDR family NAD(P)-dependent oxidoreductase n=1 Tax=Aestuariivirga sp. TaxID=2650926 RepID=UPI00391D6BC5